MPILYSSVVAVLNQLEAGILRYLNAREAFLEESASTGFPDREQEHRLSKYRVSRHEMETVERYVVSFCREKDPDLKNWKSAQEFIDDANINIQNPYDKYLEPLEMDTLQGWIRITRTYMDIANGRDGNRSETDKKPQDSKPLPKVFIVHGHDKETKLEVARFIDELNYKSVILHEIPDITRNTLAKFLEESKDAIFAVVLMTPDDIGGTTPGKLRKRARQNVIFELGFFIGKFGANRVIALIKGNVEKPSDFLGIGYISLDSKDGWKWKLSKAINTARNARPEVEGFFINEI